MEIPRFIKIANAILFVLLSLAYWLGSIHVFKSSEIIFILISAPIIALLKTSMILEEKTKDKDCDTAEGIVMAMYLYFMSLLFLFSCSSFKTYDLLVVNILYTVLLAVNLLFAYRLFLENLLNT